MPTESLASFTCDVNGAPLLLATGRRHTIDTADVSVSGVSGPDTVSPGQRNVVYEATLNVARPSVDQMKRVRWRINCGGVILVDTPAGGNRFTIHQLPSRFAGEELVVRAYVTMPSMRPYKASSIIGIRRGQGMLTRPEQLSAIMEKPLTSRLIALCDAIRSMFPRYGFDTHLSQAHFLAQVRVETGGLDKLMEIGDERYLRRYAQKNGNTGIDDALAFRGRGILQITGYETYNAFFRNALGLVLTRSALRDQAERVSSEIRLAVEAGGYFWRGFKQIHEFANNDDGYMVSWLVNGVEDRQTWFPKAYDERIAALIHAKQILNRG